MRATPAETRVPTCSTGTGQGDDIVSDQQGKSESGFVEIGDLISEKRVTRRDVLKGAAAAGCGRGVGSARLRVRRQRRHAAAPPHRRAAAGAQEGRHPQRRHRRRLGQGHGRRADGRVRDPTSPSSTSCTRASRRSTWRPRSSTRWPRRSSPTPTAPSGHGQAEGRPDCGTTASRSPPTTSCTRFERIVDPKDPKSAAACSDGPCSPAARRRSTTSRWSSASTRRT